jgi:hypothetical protein
VIRLSAAAAVLVLAFAAAGCGGEEEEKEAAGKACGPAPTALAGEPKLPSAFPTPDGVTYTSSTEKGPSTVVEGFREGEIEEAFDAYKDAFPDAGYDVTKDEREEVDAEVNFAGSGTDGQVKLVQACKDRTSVTITVRPK